MNTVQKNNNITKLQLQEYIEENYKKLRLKEKDKEQKKNYIKMKKSTREKINI